MGLYEHWPYANFHELNLDWIVKEMKAIRTEMEEIETWKTAWDGTLEELENRYNVLTELYDQLVEEQQIFKSDITSQMRTFESSMNVKYQTFENVVNSQMTGMSRLIGDLDTKLDNAIDNFSQNLTMSNPFTGEKTSLTDVINILASFHMEDALTALEYDNKELTAAAYDALQLTAYQYDVEGSLYIS